MKKSDSIISHSETIITAKEITSSGMHRSILQQLVSTGKIFKYSKGIYVKTDAWEDEFQLLQKRYPRGIYSHNTALYLLGFSDRTPARFTMTFPHGYNTVSLKDKLIEKKQAVSSLYNAGIIEIIDYSGNKIKVYCLEKTLCDMMRGNTRDIEVITAALKKYSKSPDKNIPQLLKYAKLLRVSNKIQPYLEVLL